MDVTDIEQLIATMRRAGIMHLTLGQATCKIAITRGAEGPVVSASVPAVAVVAPVALVEVAPKVASGETPVASPVVGVVRSGAASAKVGARVKMGQVLISVEAMKVPNDVRAPADGVVSAVLVEEGSPVEYGQTLYVIVPDKGGENDEDEAAIGLA